MSSDPNICGLKLAHLLTADLCGLMNGICWQFLCQGTEALIHLSLPSSITIDTVIASQTPINVDPY